MRVPALPFGILLAGLVASGAASAQSAATHPMVAFEEAEISINNKAAADGYVRFRITPVGGQAVDLTVDILAKMRENEIADDITKALTLALRGKYEVKGGGESIRIRKPEKTAANFTVEVAFNTPGLGITLAN